MRLPGVWMAVLLSSSGLLAPEAASGTSVTWAFTGSVVSDRTGTVSPGSAFSGLLRFDDEQTGSTQPPSLMNAATAAIAVTSPADDGFTDPLQIVGNIETLLLVPEPEPAVVLLLALGLAALSRLGARPPPSPRTPEEARRQA